MAQAAALASGETHTGSHRTLAVVVLVLGVFMAIMDTSVVNVAIPTMEAALGATTDQIQWVLTGYILVLGMLIPASGWLSDQYGSKRVFLGALLVFTAGSALCGLAWDLGSLIFFRILQGVGGAFMQPVAMAMIYRMYPPDRRGAVMGVLGVALMAAPAFGPLLSGYLVDYVSWRYIFYINVPFGIIAMLLGTVNLPEFAGRPHGRFDLPGFVLSVIGFGALLYGSNEAGTYSWHSWHHVVPFLIGGGIALTILVPVEWRKKEPLINLHLLKYDMFTMSLLMVSILSVAMYAGVFFLPIYLQTLRGYTAVRTGLFMTPAAMVAALIMPFSGRLFDRIGARPLAIVGLGIITAATYGFTLLDLNTPASTIQWLYIARSAGIGLSMMPITTAGMNVVPRMETNQASAISSTFRQVAGSFGVALLTTYMTTRAYIHAVHYSWQITSFSIPGQFLRQLQAMLQQAGIAAAVAPQMAANLLNDYLQEKALVAGMNDAFTVAGILAAVALVLSFFYHSAHEEALRRGNGSAATPPPEL